MTQRFDEVMERATKARIDELERLVKQANHEYYVAHAPTVSDEVFDAWRDELLELRADSPAATMIGAPVPDGFEWKKQAHSIPMGSLDKVNTHEELTSWIRGASAEHPEQLFVTEKLDGISIAVSYQSGVFSQAVTRGDGEVGEDISVNVAKMKGVPGKLPKRFTGTIRGEVIVSKSVFTSYFAHMKSTRNAAGGIAHRHNGQGCEHLEILFYQVADGVDFVTEAEMFTWLQDQGFKIPNWYVTAMAPGIKTPHDLWLEYQQTKRAALDYEIDGLVVRLNNLSKQIALGETNGRPKGAVAFKFAAVTRESTCRDIVNQTGAMGIITPVCVFDPIQLVGATVTQASLYNWKYVRDLGLAIGAKILVARANDVIPRVLQVTVSTNTVAEPPKGCPSCGAETEWDGEFLICPNTASCPAQAVGRLKRYVKNLDIKEWGDGLIEKLIDGGHAKTVADLYRLTEGQLVGVERMGEKTAQKVLKTLWARNPIPVEELVGSLSIPKCGTSMVKLAVDAGFDSIDKLKAVTPDQLAAINGFGPIKAKCLTDWMQADTLIEELLELGVKVKERITGTLTGKSFCFTGASSRPRTELEELAKKAGAEVKKQVTKKLDYLVMADAKSTTTKAQAARANGTECLSEEDFLKMVGA